MKRMVAVLVTLGFVGVVPACQSGTDVTMDSPEAAVKSFLKAVDSEDAEAIASVSVGSDLEAFKKMSEDEQNEELGELKKMFGGAKVEGVEDKKDGTAKVMVKLTGADRPIPVSVTKTDGDWQIKNPAD